MTEKFQAEPPRPNREMIPPPLEPEANPFRKSNDNICRHCGHGPVAVDARSCPQCGGGNPNPGRGSRWGAWGALIGAVAAVGWHVISGIIYQYAMSGIVILSFYYAAIGAFLGLLGGMAASGIARLLKR